jgi:hypothetical protein
MQTMSGFGAISRPNLVAIRPRAKYSRRLSVAGYQWAKEVKPMQPGEISSQLSVAQKLVLRLNDVLYAKTVAVFVGGIGLPHRCRASPPRACLLVLIVATRKRSFTPVGMAIFQIAQINMIEK